MRKRIIAIAIGSSVIVVTGLVWFCTYITRPADATPVVPSVVQSQPVVLPTIEGLLSAVNAQRVKVGASPLAVDQRLDTSAQRKADDEVTYNYFGHVSPADNRHGYEYIDDTGIICREESENLYTDGAGITVNRAIDWWMHSPPHKAAMLDTRYTLTGFGISLMPDKRTVNVVEHFCEA